MCQTLAFFSASLIYSLPHLIVSFTYEADTIIIFILNLRKVDANWVICPKSQNLYCGVGVAILVNKTLLRFPKISVNLNKAEKPNIFLKTVTVTNLFLLACGRENLKSCVFLSMRKMMWGDYL